MTQTVAARAYRACKITDPAVSSGVQQLHLGAYATVHSAAPPPVAEYDEWLAARAPKCRNGVRSRAFNMTGAKLRRAVVMRRQGETLAEAGRAIGIGGPALMDWLARLPSHLAVDPLHDSTGEKP